MTKPAALHLIATLVTLTLFSAVVSTGQGEPVRYGQINPPHKYTEVNNNYSQEYAPRISNHQIHILSEHSENNINHKASINRRKRHALSPRYTTIRPGSKPSSPFDNDPTVSCKHNPHQSRCQKKQVYNDDVSTQRSLSYFTEDGVMVSVSEETPSLSCADFYNKSDDKLLWWQALQREVSYSPEYIIIYLDNYYPCPDESRIDFYIRDKPYSAIKEVDTERGLQLRKHKRSEPKSVGICYFTLTESLDPQHYLNIVHSFLDCLYHYGRDI